MALASPESYALLNVSGMVQTPLEWGPEAVALKPIAKRDRSASDGDSHQFLIDLALELRFFS